MRDSLPIDMLLSAVSFLVVAQSSSEVPEGHMNNHVYLKGLLLLYSTVLKILNLSEDNILNSFCCTSAAVAEFLVQIKDRPANSV